MSAFRPHLDIQEMEKIVPIGMNPAHDSKIENIRVIMARKKHIRLSKVLKTLTKGKNFGISLPKNLFPKRKKKVADTELPPNNISTTNKTIVIPEISKKIIPNISITTSGEKPPQFAWAD